MKRKLEFCSEENDSADNNKTIIINNNNNSKTMNDTSMVSDVLMEKENIIKHDERRSNVHDGDKIKFVENKKGIERSTQIQRNNVAKKLIIKNFGNSFVIVYYDEFCLMTFVFFVP